MKTDRPTVLIVDGSETDRRIVRDFLHKRYTLREAENGQQALARLRELQPACVLLNAPLSDMSGMEFLEALRSRNGVVPVVVVLARGGDTRAAVTLMKSGAEDFLDHEGLTPAALTQAIAEAVERAAKRRTLLCPQADLGTPRIGEKWQKLLLEHAPAAIALLDRDMRYLATSRRWREDYRLDTDPVGRSHYDIFPDCPERWREVHRQALTGAAVANPHDRFERTDGSVHWLRWEVLPWRTADDTVGGIVILSEDITERKLAEDQIAELSRFNRIVLDSVGAHLCVLDADGAILAVNRAWMNYAAENGATPDKVGVGINYLAVCDAAGADDASVHLLAAGIREVIGRQRDEFAFEYPCHLPDGTERWFMARAVRCCDEDPIRVVVSHHDVSEQKQAENEIFAGRASLEAALASMADAVFITDTQPKLTHFNEAFAHFHRFADKNECPRKLAAYPAILDVFQDGGQPLALEDWAIPRALRGETATGVEYRLRRKDTGETWCGSYSFAPIRDRDGAIVGSVVSGRDITEQRRLADELRESELRFRQLAENIQDVFWVSDYRARRMIYVSPAIERVLGLDREALCGDYDAWIRAIHPEDRRRVQQAFHTHAAAGTFNEEYRMMGADGAVFHMRDRCFPVRDAQGKVYRLTGIAQDVTRQREAETALRASEERLQLALEVSDGGAWDWDLLRDEVTVSRSYREIYGLSEDQPLSHQCNLATLHPEDREPCRTYTRDFFLSGTDFRFEFRIHHPRRGLRWLNAVGHLQRDGDGQPERFVGITLDVTDRKHAEEALRRSEQFLRLAQDAAHAGSWEWNMKTGANEWSTSLWALYGLTPGQVRPSFNAWAETIHPDDRARAIATAESAAAAQKEFEMQWRLKVPAGNPERWLLGRGRPVLGKDGQLERYFGIVIDVTERKAAELALAESEEKYRTLLESLRDGVFVAQDFRFVFANLALLELLGYSSAEFNGLPFSAVIAPEFLTVWNERFARRVRGSHPPWRYEVPLLCKNGKTLWTELSARRIHFRGQWAVLGVLRDATQRRAAEDALRASEERFRKIFEHAPIGIGIASLDGRLQNVNPAYAAILGYAQDELAGQRFKDLIHPDDWPANMTQVEQLQNGRIPFFEIETRYRRKDGTTVWVHRFTATLPDNLGKPAQFLALLSDISERRRMEAVVRESEQRLWALVHSAMDAIITVDEQQRIILFNPAAERLFGLSTAEALGSPLRRLLPERFHATHEDHVHSFGESGVTARRMGQLGRITGLKANGQEFPLEVSISQMPVAEGKLFTAIIRDISEREQAAREKKLAERRLRQQRLRLEEAFRHYVARQTGAAIAHELNQPLAAAATYASVALRMLAETPVDLEDLRQVVTNAENQTQRAGRVVHELMRTLHKGESAMEALELKPLVDESLGALSASDEIDSTEIDVETESGLPPVQANRLQIEKVLVNLLRNALQAMPDRHSPSNRITIKIGRLATSPSLACITVSDNGKGFSEHELQSLFQPFYTTKASGLGMGLAVSRALIEAHGGKLWAEPNAEGGARFHFTLPFVL